VLPKLLVVTRDGRAVVNSHARKNTGMSVASHTRAWVGKMHKVEALAANWAGPLLRVRYEDLAARPRSTMTALCAFLGVDYDPRMVAPWRGSEPHPLDSNPGPLVMFRHGGSGWPSINIDVTKLESSRQQHLASQRTARPWRRGSDCWGYTTSCVRQQAFRVDNRDHALAR
jgi:hypothetical protein